MASDCSRSLAASRRGLLLGWVLSRSGFISSFNPCYPPFYSSSPSPPSLFGLLPLLDWQQNNFQLRLCILSSLFSISFLFFFSQLATNARLPRSRHRSSSLGSSRTVCYYFTNPLTTLEAAVQCGDLSHMRTPAHLDFSAFSSSLFHYCVLPAVPLTIA